MSDMTSFNDPELIDLEQRLTAVTLTPTPRQREQLLYSCGLAAGRAQLRRQVHLMSCATGMLACLSAGMGFLLLAGTPPETALDTTEASLNEGERTDSRSDLVAGEQQTSDQNRRWHLSAGTSVDEWLIAESQRNTEPLIVDPSRLPSKQVLTAASRWWADELWE